MTKINLLPWREELRAERQKQFIVMLVGAAVIGVGVWLVGHMHFSAQIDHQRYRNQILQNEIKVLDEKIVKIRDLEKTKQQLISRMNVIQDLQQGRPLAVRLLYQLAMTVPEGVSLNSFSQSGENLTLQGVAESNARVSSYMESIDASEDLGSPKLNGIDVQTTDAGRVSNFSMVAKQLTDRNDKK